MGTRKHFKGLNRMYKSMVYFFILKSSPVFKIGIPGIKKQISLHEIQTV